MKYRAALIGCGKIGCAFTSDHAAVGVYTHAGAYAACPHTMLVAVCDLDDAAAQSCAERWKVPSWYSNPQKMLAEQQPDLVSICAPDAAHYQLARLVLETVSVRGLLVEKPLTLQLIQAQDLVALACDRGVVLAVNYTRRYTESHQWLREHLRDGGIGQIQTVLGLYTKGIIHNGTHWFDLVRFLVGEIVRVLGRDRLGETGEDPTLDAVLEFANGASGCLQGCDSGAFSVFELDLIGTGGRIRITDSGHGMELYRVAESPYYSGYRTLIESSRRSGGMANALLHAVEDVVACMREGAAPRCSGSDGVAALRIALAVRESARSGRAIWVGEDGGNDAGPR